MDELGPVGDEPAVAIFDSYFKARREAARRNAKTAAHGVHCPVVKSP